MNDDTGGNDVGLPSFMNPQLTYNIASGFNITTGASRALLRGDEALESHSVVHRNGSAKVTSSIGNARKQNELFHEIMDIPKLSVEEKEEQDISLSTKEKQDFAPVRAIVRVKGEIKITPMIMRAAVKGRAATIGINLKNGKEDNIVEAQFNGCSEFFATKEFIQAKKDMPAKGDFEVLQDSPT